MNLQLRDGVYDENLNKTDSIFKSMISNKKAYIVSKGRRYEIFVSVTGIGTISIIDVTEAGKYRGEVVILSLDGFYDDRHKLKKLIADESGDDPNWYIETFKRESGQTNSKTMLIGEQPIKKFLKKHKSSTYFSLLGTYNRLKKRPKRWNVALLMRALMNYQVQETRHYRYDDMRGTQKGGQSSLTKNIDLTKMLFISNPMSIYWSYDIKSPNTIHVMHHSNDFYDLEIIDEDLRV